MKINIDEIKVYHTNPVALLRASKDGIDINPESLNTSRVDMSDTWVYICDLKDVTNPLEIPYAAIESAAQIAFAKFDDLEEDLQAKIRAVRNERKDLLALTWRSEDDA